MSQDTYSMKDVFDEFRVEVREDLRRIESKVEKAATDVTSLKADNDKQFSEIRVKGAEAATRGTMLQAIVMSIVGIGAGIVSAVVTANIVQGAVK